MLGVATAVGAALRFGTLAHQGFWFDEGTTVFLVHQHIGHMLHLLPQVESAPPLYYLVAWAWAHVFGTSEAGLRSLSAVTGTAMIPLAYALGAQLATRRVGAAAAALTACSPILVWYSQEARAYSLLVLLTGVALLFFLRALSRPSGWNLAGWAVASALALATHYYALVAAVPEAVWLLVVHRLRPRTLLAVAGVAAVGGALLPLAISQRGTLHTRWIAMIPLDRRLDQLVDQFVGWVAVPRVPFTLAACALAVGALLVLRAERDERRRAAGAAALGLAGLALAVGLVAVNLDDFITRNVIAAWVPLALAVSIGMASRRAGVPGVLAALALCGAWIALDLAIDTDPVLQKPDWRRVSAALGRPRTARVIVLKNRRPSIPLALYQPGLKRVHGRTSVLVTELDVVTTHVPRHQGHSCWWGSACNLHPARPPRHTPPGFRPAGVERASVFRIWRFSSPRPRRLTARALRREVGDGGRGAVLLQIPGRGLTALTGWPL